MTTSNTPELPTARLVVFVLGGTLVCSAVVVLVPIVTIHSALIGEVHGAQDVVAEAMFFVLATSLLVVVARAWLRVKRAGAAQEYLGWVAKLAPVVAVAGAGLGVWASVELAESHVELIDKLGEMTCRDALGYAATEQELRACTPTGVSCNKAEEDRRRALHLGNTDARIGAERLQAACVRARLGLPEPKGGL